MDGSQREPESGAGPDGVAADGVEELAMILRLPVAALRVALGGPWQPGIESPAYGHDVTVFVGLVNPRVPDRPLVVLRVDHDAAVVDVGRAIGVALPSGTQQWSLGEPRASIGYDEPPLDEAWGAEHSAALLLEELGAAVAAVLDSAVLRGTAW